MFGTYIIIIYKNKKVKFYSLRKIKSKKILFFIVTKFF